MLVVDLVYVYVKDHVVIITYLFLRYVLLYMALSLKVQLYQ